MVRTFKRFIKGALKWCWSALRRSLAPAVNALATSPLDQSEKVLGSSSRFRLSSVITSAPIAETSEFRQVLDAKRAQFGSGLLFQSLDAIGSSGAVIIAHISERGSVNAEHFLAVYPLCGPTQSLSRLHPSA